MSKNYFDIKFVTLGQKSTEIRVILKVLPLDFSAILHLSIMILLNVMTI